MQPLGLTSKEKTAYLDRLFHSHTYTIRIDVMGMNENIIDEIVFLDGQVNLQSDSDVRRTASITVSDPEGMFDFAGASSWSSGTMWADRLVRVRHLLKVPALGRTITTIPFIGTPSSLARAGAEVTMELQDKSALAMRGTKPFTVTKGTNAVAAIKKIMKERTGEARLRLPAVKNVRLSKNYSVGWTDEASPWAVVQKIAASELGRQLIYSCDGYLTLRKKPTSSTLTIPMVTELPATEVDFTILNNYVRVLGKRTTSKQGSTTVTTQPEGIAAIAAGNQLSPSGLSRHYVPRYWPLVVTEDSITSAAQAKKRANAELTKTDQLQDVPTYSCVPFFHGDVDDLVQFNTPDGSIKARLGDCSIPLGATGDMSVGSITRNVSKAPKHRVTAKNLTTKKRKKNKKKTTGKK